MSKVPIMATEGLDVMAPRLVCSLYVCHDIIFISFHSHILSYL